jgi:hypothetical protein
MIIVLARALIKSGPGLHFPKSRGTLPLNSNAAPHPLRTACEKQV